MAVAAPDSPAFEWERLPDEPTNWFARFRNYLEIGPERRSLLKVYRAERDKAGKSGGKLPKSIPGAWTKIAQKWRWGERAELWDNYELAEKSASFEQAKREEREFRLLIIRSLRGKLAEALNLYDVSGDDLSLSKLAHVASVVLREVRHEFEETGNGFSGGRLTEITAGGPVRIVQTEFDADTGVSEMTDQEALDYMNSLLAEDQ